MDVRSLISFGAGVNSTALAILLVREGWRGPIVLAETGTEWPDTYCFIETFRGWLEQFGLDVTMLGAEWRTSGWHKKTLIEYLEHYRLTPRADFRFCTACWKIEPLDKFALANGITEQLLGIAADEAHREKGRNCPLIRRGITRKDCIKIIEREGLPVPRKSGCWLCMFQRRWQWRELWERYPELYARAENLERLATERRGQQAHITIGSEFTLAQLRAGFEAQIPMFDDETLDSLQIYKPCVCGL